MFETTVQLKESQFLTTKKFDLERVGHYWYIALVAVSAMKILDNTDVLNLF